MNRNYLLQVIICLVVVGLTACGGNKAEEQTTQKGGMSLMESLQKRHSVRAFSQKQVPDSMLMDLLWAANGVNRPDGKRTAPSAINAQDIDLYVGKADGCYHYVPADKKLVKVNGKDMRPIVAMQNNYVITAPVVVLLVSDLSKFSKHPERAENFADMDAGYVSQNIYLYCTSVGLGTVADAPDLKSTDIIKFLGLPASNIPVMVHPVGYPAE
ncbi:MAG: nitroreductase family protein [Muribaculaceae bacterium]|jgi:SagB-type dehydrogenase family enzyme|nr:nitroreductase family protein [Muribaculaceae bacterium]